MPINPVDMILSALNNGINPMAAMQQIVGMDPRIGQAMQMINGKSPAQLEQMAKNMAKERGTTVEQIAQNLGIKIR